MSEKKESNAFFWGFVLGAAAGAVLTLLKTPRSGKETIGEIRARGQQLRNRGVDYADKTASQMGDFGQKAQSQAEDFASQAKSQAQDAADAVSAQAEKTVDAASGLVEETIDVVEEQIPPGTTLPDLS